MRWVIKERNADLCSECTSTQITRSSCIDCQGTFHVLRSEDLWTFRFFWRSEFKLIKNIFDLRKIFVSWPSKHESIYKVNLKRIKQSLIHHSFLFKLVFFVLRAIFTVLLTAHIFGVPKQMARWTFGRGAYSWHEIHQFVLFLFPTLFPKIIKKVGQ